MPHPSADLPESWRQALGQAAEKRRVLVLGATDVGKTTFVRTFLQNPGEATQLIDLDPGQKMIGPPGSVGLGQLERLERFLFIGTTSSTRLSAIARAAATLAAVAEGKGAFIVNTSGMVAGIGARLQAMTAAAVEPDLIVEIGAGPIVKLPEGAALVRIEPSPLARPKTPSARAALRQASFDRALAGASLLILPLEAIEIQPAPPAAWKTPLRPVCSLADDDGVDMKIGVLEAADDRALYVRAAPPDRAVRLVRLGSIWVEPKEGRWHLVERLAPSWKAR